MNQLYFTTEEKTCILTSKNISNFGTTTQQIRAALEEICSIDIIVIVCPDTIIASLRDIICLARIIVNLSGSAEEDLSTETDFFCMTKAFGNFIIREVKG